MIASPTSSDLGRTVSLLWLFAILNILFRDVHELTTASSINEILTGHVNGNPVTEELLFVAAFAVELLLLAFLLSALLPAKAVRALNIVLAPLAVTGVIFGAPADLDDYFFAAVSLIVFVAIFVICVRWKPGPPQGRRKTALASTAESLSAIRHVGAVIG